MDPFHADDLGDLGVGVQSRQDIFARASEGRKASGG